MIRQARNITVERQLKNMNHLRTKLLNQKPIRESKVKANTQLFAEINHGRWIVRCPYCAGAEMVNAENPIFMCMSCWNAGTNEFISVVFPSGETMFQIEALLLERPNIENHNWDPVESVDDLRNENIAHGVK